MFAGISNDGGTIQSKKILLQHQQNSARERMVGR